MAGELIASLIPLIEAAHATAATSATSNLLNKDKAKLGDEVYVPGKNTVDAVKDLIGKKIEKNKLNSLLVDLVESGLSSEDAKQIADSGYFNDNLLSKLDEKGIDVLADYLGIPSKELRDKVSKMTDEDINKSTGNDNQDPNKNPKDAAKAAAKAEALKKARDKYQQWNEKEQEFVSNTFDKAREGRAKWGKTFNVPGKSAKQASQELTNDMERLNSFERVSKSSPQLQGLSGAEKAEVGERAMDNAIKNGTIDEWIYNHVRPLNNIVK